MSKIKNRFIALLMVFTSIISFLPAGLGGQTAMAADSTSEATTIRVNITGQSSKLPSRVDTTTSEKIYSTTELVIKDDIGFDLTVKDVTTTVDKLTEDATGDGTKKKSVSGIVEQKVEIVSINGTPISDPNGVLAEIGVSVKEIVGTDATGEKVVGKRILGLPFGINKIEYDVKIATQSVTYTPAEKDAQGNITKSSETKIGDKVYSQNTSNQKLTIEHATTFVTSQIKSLMFKSYVGNPEDFGSNDEISLTDNNEAPFLYLQTAEADKDMPLRYNFDLPDSTKMLKYIIGFSQSLNGAKIYKNGVKDESTDITGNNTLVGSLSKMGDSALIVLKISSDSNTTDASLISKAYAIEIRYNPLNADKDYSLKNAGITKLDYNDDSSVKTYIGKKFTVSKNSAGFPVYEGDIYIDSRARMISIDPTLIRSKNTVAYVVTNRYADSSGVTRTKQSILKNGQQFIEFGTSTTKNEIQVDVYEGSNGSISNSSKILARYLLTVNPVAGSQFAMDLGFTSSENTYLTQPGVKTNVIDFTSSRRTYDLCFGDLASDLAGQPVGDPVTVSFTGTRSDKNEYIRVFFASDVDSNNLKEAQASIDNAPVDKVREKSINVSVGTAKKMVVQAYYDEFTTKTVDGVETTILKASYPVGDKYVFYLPNNFDKSDTSNPGETSNNASLSSVKIKGYTLKDSDGNEGFSSDKFDYSTTVAKEDTNEKITVIAEDDNVKSIVATINNAEESYDLVSGQTSELPLNSSGTTTIKIVVTAQDGTTTKTYTIVVSNNKKGSNVNLKNVILNVGDYTFDSKEDTTKVRVDQNVNNIKVTPLPEDPKAKVTVEGQEFLESPISVSLKGAQKTEISIKVESEDGTESKTYTLDVYRVNTSDWEDDSDDDDSSEDDQFYDEYNECWIDLTKYEEWGTVNGKPAYFDKKSRQVKDAWISTGGKYYYLNNLGYRASGWKVDSADGKTYYLDPTTGEMRKGWMNLNNSWYYLGLNGVMYKGWLYLNGKWYYFTPNGQMVVNQSMYVEGKVYKFGQDGAIY